MPHVRLRFYAELNEHLPAGMRQAEFSHAAGEGATLGTLLAEFALRGNEVDLILVNGESAALSHILRENDRVSIYPVFDSIDVTPLTKMDDRPRRRMRFVLDVHLGKLAHHLRMMGFDTLYRNDYTRSELLGIASRDDRILLSKSSSLVEAEELTAAYRVRSSDPREQLLEVLTRFDLWRAARPFVRCLHCNSLLQPEAKNAVAEHLPEKVRELYLKFNRCPSCGRIYWEGTHFQKMQAFIVGLAGEARIQA
ncbi:MAG TPA: Mut7-C RNAse domain-containing protein [Bacteroidota bacterium]|nr:Mut7-C RNAse domain-containing protein [Bacteroidota bacterium]